jgi:hypothetical protein
MRGVQFKFLPTYGCTQHTILLLQLISHYMATRTSSGSANLKVAPVHVVKGIGEVGV